LRKKKIGKERNEKETTVKNREGVEEGSVRRKMGASRRSLDGSVFGDNGNASVSNRAFEKRASQRATISDGKGF
jgi:hypothetical protein